MIIENAGATAQSNMTSVEHTFQVKQSVFMMELLSKKLYTDAELAVSREIISNALDASNKVTVKAPTDLEPVFSVRDYGTGLSDEDMLSLFGTYGGSSKQQDNSKIGGFGVGCKSPFALTDAFTVTSIQGGYQSVWGVYKSNGLPCMRLITKSETKEPSGLLVEVPIDNVYSFRKSLDQYLSAAFALGYNHIQVENLKVTPLDICYEDSKFIIRRESPSKTRVAMGPNTYLANAVGNVWGSFSLIYKADIGDVPVSASRESVDLSCTEELKKRFQEHLDTLSKVTLKQAYILERAFPRAFRTPKREVFSKSLRHYFVSTSESLAHPVYEDIPHIAYKRRFVEYCRDKLKEKIYLTTGKNLLDPHKRYYLSELKDRYYDAFMKLEKRRKASSTNQFFLLVSRYDKKRKVRVKLAELPDSSISLGWCEGYYGASPSQYARIQKIKSSLLVSEESLKAKKIAGIQSWKKQLRQRKRVSKVVSEVTGLPQGLLKLTPCDPLSKRYIAVFGDYYKATDKWSDLWSEWTGTFVTNDPTEKQWKAIKNLKGFYE